MSQTPAPHDDVAARRQRARRIAWWLAALALAVYAGFLLSAVVMQ